jgi:ribosomal-protein-alanine N-acetyltransferase
VCQIELQSFDDPFPVSLFERTLRREPETFLVASRDNEAVGYVIASIENTVGHILSIAVEPKERRKRIGTALFTELLKILANKKVPSMRLEVRRSNSVARAFYKNLGFSESGIAKNYYLDGEDAVVMLRTQARPQ